MDYCVPKGIAWSTFRSWDELDRQYALAWEANQAEICACGTRADEWEHDRFAYVAQSRRCPGCEIIEQEREQQRGLPGGDKGLRVFLMPRALAGED